MPVHRGRNFYQYGTQKRYYYTPGNASSRARAKALAVKQMRAIKRRQAQR